MKQHTLLFALFAIGALLIAGCSTPYNAKSSEAPAQNESLYGQWPSSQPPPPPEPKQERTPRGFIPATIGVPYEVSENGQPVYTITFTEVTTDVQCESSYPTPGPENGNLLAVSMKVETGPTTSGYATLPSQSNFTIYSPQGVVESSTTSFAAYSCQSQDTRFPSTSLTPSSRYEGTVLLDTANPTGFLAYRPSMYGASTGLELLY